MSSRFLRRRFDPANAWVLATVGTGTPPVVTATATAADSSGSEEKKQDVIDAKDIYLRCICRQKRKILTIHLLPHVILFNKMLCTIHFRLSSGGGAEESSLAPGQSFKICRIKWHQTPAVSFRIGSSGRLL